LALTTHPHLAPRLNKEQTYKSTPLLCLRGSYWANFILIYIKREVINNIKFCKKIISFPRKG